ncbi:MAG: helicase, partial [Gemmatimonadetes bacterium]|nr:helicase [Gemmatimonadota bacterium]
MPRAVHLVRVGGATKAELLTRLAAAQVQLNQLAKDLFADPRFTTATTVSVIEAVEISVSELGLPSGGTTSQLFERATFAGLSLCPLELGPHLRLQFT